MSQESKTPRTDAAWTSVGVTERNLYRLSCDLERELAAVTEERDALIADKRIKEANSGWQPIETCPFYKLVLLWCPENSPWAATVWKGMRQGGSSVELGHDEKFTIATPYGSMESSFHKQVYCPIDMQKHWPTHWMPLPEPPKVGAEIAEANANLIAEAFNVYTETGMTPRELKELARTWENEAERRSRRYEADVSALRNELDATKAQGGGK